MKHIKTYTVPDGNEPTVDVFAFTDVVGTRYGVDPFHKGGRFLVFPTRAEAMGYAQACHNRFMHSQG